MLFHCIYTPEHDPYFNQITCKLPADADIGALLDAWRQLLARHATLRTAFVWQGLDRPLQVVLREVPLPVEQLDWRDRDDHAIASAIEEFMRADRARGVDPSQAPLTRFALIRTRSDVRLVWSFHHLLLDGWSLPILFTELFALYHAKRTQTKPALPTRRPYRDHIAWLAAQDQAEAERFWRQALDGFDAPTAFDPAGALSAAHEASSREETRRTLSREATFALDALARKSHVTLNTIVQAAWSLLLAAHAGKTDVVFGATVSGRSATLQGVEAMVGLFINTIPVRIAVPEDVSVERFLHDVQDRQVELRNFEHTPLVDIQAWSSIPRGTALFDSLVVFENYPIESFAVSEDEGVGISVDDVRFVENTNYPLTLVVGPGAELLLKLDHDAARFGKAWAEPFLDRLEHVLAQLTQPERRVRDVSLLTPNEKSLLLTAWNATARDYPREATFVDGFLAQVERTPEALAVTWPGGALSYRDLERRSAGFAVALAGTHAPRESIVAILDARSHELLPAILGVLRAGLAYVPLDPHHPPARIRAVLQGAGARIAIVGARFQKLLDDAAHPFDAVLPIDGAFTGDLRAIDARRPRPEHLAYVIFTSGSTGLPKGAMVEHRGMLNHLFAKVRDLELSDEDVVVQNASQCFDISVWQFLVALLHGGTTHVLDDEIAHDPKRLIDAAARDRVSVLEVVPSMLRAVLDDVETRIQKPDLTSLRWLVATGEALPPDLCARWFDAFPDVPLLNAYGPTECSDDVTHFPMTRAPSERSTPIGFPLQNTALYVMGPSAELCPVGVPGELWVGGDGVGRGYVQDPSRTADVFVPDPFSSSPGARLYRTGDLVRRRPDGAIEFLGRIDHQVKVRGFRIELGEIELALRAHPDVSDAAVLAREDNVGDKRLVAYFVPSASTHATNGALEERITSSLRGTLPDYMIPSAFVALDALPLNPNGKLDRKALPAPDLTEARGAYVAPETPLEERVASICADVLGLSRLSVVDDFFALGGHSLLVTRVVSKLRSTLNVEFSMRTFFEAPTARGIARAIGGGANGTAGAPRLVAVPRTQAPPLSFAQQRLWFLDQLQPGHAFYNIPIALRVRGRVDVDALGRSLRFLQQRHEALRTTFVAEGGVPHQRIAEGTDLELRVQDARDEAIRALALEEAQRPFDLERGPLVRALLLRVTDDDAVLVLTLHHIVSDEWSTTILAKELSAAYFAFARGETPELPRLAVQYADFAAWQRSWLSGRAMDDELAWWKRALDGAPQTLDLPTDHPRPAIQEHRGATFDFHVPRSIAEAVTALGHDEGATPFMAFLAAFQLLLAKYSGQDDVCVGSPISGRTHSETEELIGFFVNTLVLRARAFTRGSFRSLVRQVRATALEAYEHQHVPFERLVEELQPVRDTSRSPLFQVMFVLQNDLPGELAAEGRRGSLAFSPYSLEGTTAKFDLTLLVHEGAEGLDASFEFDTDLFERSTVERMAEHFTTLLARVARAPDAAVDTLSILSDGERETLLRVARGPEGGYPSEATFVDRFLEQVERTPDALAATWPGGSISYRELERRSAGIALALAKTNAPREAIVAVLDTRSHGLLPAILGVLRAGLAYVPLDPHHPPARIRAVLQGANARIAIVGASCKTLLDEAAHPFDATLPIDGEFPTDRAIDDRRPKPQHLAYVIFTSGSTGLPKGAMVEHRGMLNHLFAKVRDLELSDEDVVVQNASQCFDISVWQFLVALLHGGTTHVLDDEIAHDPKRLIDAAARDRVSVLEVVPSMLRAVLDDVETRIQKPDLTSLRWLVATGEALPPDLCARWFDAFPDVPLLNAYGPTECSDDVTHFPMTRAPSERSTPIGFPLQNTALYVMGPSAELCPVGVPGELWVGGDGVGRGYVQDPSRTADVFVPDPFSSSPGARLYRTGDLVRRRPDGAIEFLGRIDHQVKVRGFRIELGEIELALRAHPDVSDVVVVVREERPGDKRLVAYVVAEGLASGELASELAASLRGTLPDYMVPSAFVALDAIPLTANGKVDRKALPSSGEDAVPDSAYAAPRGPLEQSLVAIWSRVLGVPRVGIHDDFFALGGHSLLATQVVSRIRATLSRELPLRALFEHPTVARLAGVLAASSAEANDAFPLTKARRDEPLPLSFAQERLWFLDQLEPGSVAYNIPIAVRLHGHLDVDALQRSILEIVRRHEALRTTFLHDGGRVHQHVRDDVTASLPLLTLDSDQALLALLENEAATPFDLARGPLLRATLLAIAEDQHVLLFTMHHIVSDGWSMGILVHELAALYSAFSKGLPSPLEPLAIQYPDFTAWQRAWLESGELQRQLAYWRQKLAGAPPSLELPTDKPRPPVFSSRGRTLEFEVPRELADGLRDLALREGATLFMVLLAAFDVLLARYSGQSDVVVGTPIANRTRRELEPLIGFFVNTLVLRAEIDGNATFRSLLADVKKTTLDAYAHQDVPFERLVEDLAPPRDASRTPLFQVMFALQNVPDSDVRLPGVSLEELPFETHVAKFDLALAMVERRDATLAASLEYCTDLFEHASVERMAEHLLTLLRAVASAPAASLSEHSLLSERERHTLLVAWNEARDHRPDAVLVHELFEEQVERAPDAWAVVSGEERLTYAQLNARANQLAHHLRDLGVGADARVAVYLERSPEAIVAMLAVLKAGGAYVPIDPSYPSDRVAFLLQDAEPLAVVSCRALASKLNVRDVAVVSLDSTPDVLARQPVSNPASKTAAAALAYVIYTSGSTGEPKGAAISHAALASFVRSARDLYGLGPSDLCLQFFSLSFDGCVEEIYPCLITGATLVLRTDAWLESPAAFFEHCARHGITFVDVPVAYWHELARAVERESLGMPPALRLVVVGGERALPERVNGWLRHVGGRPRVVNSYGPTETTVVVTASELVGPVAGEVPIGRPLRHVTAFVLDANLEPVPIGVAGELCIGGAALARGYLGRPDATSERFVPNPFGGPGERLYRTGDKVRYGASGELEFLGRFDDQVKVRGFRVELGEIEALLLRADSVREAVVVARELDAGSKQLVAYVVSEEREHLDVEALRAQLKAKLPEYMVPPAFAVLDALPLTPSGKVDRKALPSPEIGLAAGEHVAPRDAVEEALCTIFADVLHAPRVGIHDDFFALGGHSLLATQVVSRIRATLSRELPLRALFEHPTVARLAGVLAASSAEANDAFPLTKARRDEPLPLSFAQERLWFLDQLEPGSVAYNIPIAVRLHGHLDVDALQRSILEIVRRHEALRTTFLHDGGRVHQHVRDDVTASLPLLTLDSDQALLALLENEAATPFDLARGPLLRATLLAIAEDQHVLLFTMHHIVSDGWSMGILVHELAALYSAFSKGLPSPLEPLAIQYPDFTAWQRAWLESGELQRQLAYWRQKLAGAPPSLELPTDKPRPPVFSSRGRTLEFEVPRELADGLRDLALREGATLFMVLLAAFDVLLARYSGQSDVVVGTPIANRTRRELEPLIGFFVNTLVLRAEIDGNATFRSLLADVKKTTLDAYAHQDVPFERLVEDLAPPRDASRTPLFQVMFALQNVPDSDVRLPGVSLEELPFETHVAKFDLALAMVERRDATLAASLEYCTDLFEHASVERMAEHLLTLLRAVASAPAASLSEHSLLSERERHTLLVAWNDTTTSFPRDMTIHRLFEEQVERAPDTVALVFEDEELTYAQLNARANQLAHRLRREGVGPDVLVAVCLERSVEMMVAILAVLKAGGAYVPIDLAYPKERIAYVLRDADASIVLTGEVEHPRLPPLGPKAPTSELGRCKVLRLGKNDLEGLEGESRENLAPAATALHLAYVMYTSGSTGGAKGVGIPNRGVVRLVRDNPNCPFGPEDVLLQLASIAFDGSVTEMWGPLLNGGRLVVFPPRPPTMADLAELIEERGVSTLIMTTALCHQFIDEHVEAIRGLKRLMVGGDILSPAHVQRVLREAPGVPIINLYGPTENSTFTTTYQVEGPTDRSISIGTPIGNTQVYVLDAELAPVPVGVWGELYTSGDGLARGYWNRPDLTADRFLPHPFSTEPGAVLYRTGDAVRYRPDGNIEFLGRLDHQVKHRGFRIELDEIEQALRVIPAVRDATVLLREDQPGHKRIVAYVALHEAATNEELTTHLKSALPDYMIPSAFVRLETFPLTANGKTDKRALPVPEQPFSTTAYAAPRSPLEETLVAIWESVLPVPRVGVHDDFFELGGHSLLATQALSRIRSTLRRELPLRTIFEAPTVARLASAIAASDVATGTVPLTVVRRDGPIPVSFAQERLWFLDQLEPGSVAYNIPVAVRLSGQLDVLALQRAFEEIVRRHESLRTTFLDEGGRVQQVVRDEDGAALQVVAMDGCEEEARDEVLRRFIDGEARTLSISRVGPWSARPSQAHGRAAVLLLTMHHIVSDGWSMGVLVTELKALRGVLPRPPVAAGPSRSSTQTSPRGRGDGSSPRALAAARLLESAARGHPIARSPADKARPPVFSARGHLGFELPSELTIRLRELALRRASPLHGAARGVRRPARALQRPERHRRRNADRQPYTARVRAPDRLLRQHARPALDGRRPSHVPVAARVRQGDHAPRVRAPGRPIRAPGRGPLPPSRREPNAALPSHVRPPERARRRRSAPGRRARSAPHRSARRQVRPHLVGRRGASRARGRVRVLHRPLRGRDHRAYVPALRHAPRPALARPGDPGGRRLSPRRARARGSAPALGGSAARSSERRGPHGGPHGRRGARGHVRRPLRRTSDADARRDRAELARW